MQRISDIMGKSIFSAETGDKLGTVSDILLNPAEVRLVGLVVGGGLLAKEHVLPFADVQTLGGDTVVVRSHSGLIPPAQWRESGAQATRSSDVKGKPVFTLTGRRVGTVSDIVVDERNGFLDALEIAARDFGGLLTKRSLLRTLRDIRIGPDAVVVPDDAAEQVRATEPDEEAEQK